MNERLHSVAQGFVLAVRQAPGAFTRLLLLNVVGGAAPAGVLVIQKVIVDGIAGSAGDRGLMSLLRTPSLLAAAIAGFLVLDLLLDFVEQFVDFEEATFRDRILAGTKRLILDHLAKLRGIRPFETPAFASRVNLAVASIDHFGNALNYLMVGLFAVVPVAALTATLAWWVPLLTIAAVAPSMHVQNRFEDRSWSLKQAHAETAKQMDAQKRMLTSPDYAKETRLLAIGVLLLERWQAMFDRALREVLRLRARGRRTVVLWSLLSAAGVGGAFLFVVRQGLQGTLSAGDLALYIGSVFYLRRGLVRFLHCLVELQAQGLRVKAIQDVLDVDDGLRDLPAAVRTESAEGLVFDGVTFRYAGAEQDAVRRVSFSVPPGQSVALVGANGSGKTTLVKYAGAEQDAVRRVSFSVPPGQSVALVGANGSGKTTLVKLACRLYDPDTGTVSWNGRPLPELPVDEWRASVSALMQDHSRFPVSAFDNVWFGNTDASNDDLRGVRAAARQSGIGERIERLPERWQTPLAKELSGGQDLSGGEWQRLALARAFYRSEAALVVLDEPTYGVDPAAEGDIWQRVRSWIAGRTALIVSHRLGLTRFVDGIVVMDGGRVVERGDHASLMNAGGLYARMFETQARPYRDIGDDS